mmetsp:Transcript_826/g.1291  ORF Transcript_826/g.1291 Transcript_826/m.1291 type:complete len:314 (+) Transcript_826:57-998(+)
MDRRTYTERDTLLSNNHATSTGEANEKTNLQSGDQKVIDEDIPEKLKCPITKEIMNYPVVAEDGITYEKKAILRWLQQNSSSPITREEIKPNVIKNRSIYRQIQRFKKSRKIEKIEEESYHVNTKNNHNEPTHQAKKPENVFSRIQKALESRNIHSQASAMSLIASVLTILCLPTTIIIFCIVIVTCPSRNRLWTISISLGCVVNMFFTSYVNIFSWTSRLRLLKLRYNFAGTLGATFLELWIGLLNLAMTALFATSLVITKHSYIFEYISASFMGLSFTSASIYILATLVLICFTFGLRIRNALVHPNQYDY